MVVPTPYDVAPVPPDVDISGLRRVRKRVHRQMSLERAAVLLALEQREHVFLRNAASLINPRRQVEHGHTLRAAENELADDLLHPRCAALRPGGDYDIARTKVEAVPTRRIERVIPDLARRMGPRGRLHRFDLAL